MDIGDTVLLPLVVTVSVTVVVSDPVSATVVVSDPVSTAVVVSDPLPARSKGTTPLPSVAPVIAIPELGQNEHILGHSSGTLEIKGQLVALYEVRQCDGSVLVAQSKAQSVPV